MKIHRGFGGFRYCINPSCRMFQDTVRKDNVPGFEQERCLAMTLPKVNCLRSSALAPVCFDTDCGKSRMRLVVPFFSTFSEQAQLESCFSWAARFFRLSRFFRSSFSGCSGRRYSCFPSAASAAFFRLSCFFRRGLHFGRMLARVPAIIFTYISNGGKGNTLFR